MDGMSIASYACLSYCWGGAQSLYCTPDKLDTLGNWTCNIDKLPSTLRDAFEVAQSLGIQNLWIDSLCIIQSDEADVEREILMMPQIYRNAKVTICASSANSCHDGFLHTRADYSECRIPLELPGGKQGNLYLDSHTWWSPPVKEPLGARAWALQERLLSPRILEYGWRTARWSCGCASSYSGDQNSPVVEIKGSTSRSGGPYPYSLFLYLNPFGIRLLTTSKDGLLHSWSRIVKDYTSLNISFRDDRLAAIGGIAQELQQATGVRYLAGLWDYERLPTLLQWRVTTPLLALLPRPQKSRAPSWCWPATDNAVMLHHTEEVVDGFAIMGMNVVGGFGKTASGTISLKSPIRNFNLARLQRTVRFGTIDSEETQDLPEQLVFWPDCADELIQVIDGEPRLIAAEYVFVAIGKVSWDQGLVRGLILKLDSSGLYHYRVGLFQASDSGEFSTQDWNVESITIQ